MENNGKHWKTMETHGLVLVGLVGVTLSFGAHTGEIFCNTQHFVNGNLQDQFVFGIDTKCYLFVCGNEFPYGPAQTQAHIYL